MLCNFGLLAGATRDWGLAQYIQLRLKLRLLGKQTFVNFFRIIDERLNGVLKIYKLIVVPGHRSLSFQAVQLLLQCIHLALGDERD
ncbi:hypothetical protein D9M71_720330 [compost metagenome]